MKASIKSFLLSILLLLMLIVVFAAVVKGKPGNPIAYQFEKSTEVGSPFESTNTASRYALVESIMENGRFDFTIDQARFAAPDMVQYGDKFFSIFTPGVSFVTLPFYFIGKQIGFPQLIAFTSTIVFAIVNFFLLLRITQRLGAKKPAAICAALVFTFATNALPYALTLTQHTASVTILLLCLLNATAEKRSFLNNTLFGLLYGSSLLIDFPNLFLLFPIGIYILSKNFTISDGATELKVGLKAAVVGLAVGFLPLVLLFGFYNFSLTGSPLKFGQMMVRSDYFDTKAQQASNQKMAENQDAYAPVLPFNTRAQLKGVRILLISNERSWLYYSPVIWIGLLGLVTSYKQSKTKSMSVVLLGVLVTTILLYSMFGDPWGGWTFGPRYLIPAAAILAIFLAMAIERFARNLLFSTIFLVLSFYSIFITFAGALTTNSIPPKVEAEQLSQFIPYTVDYNFQKLSKNESSSLFYNSQLKNEISLKNYHYGLFGFTSFILFIIYISRFTNELKFRKNKE